MSFLVGKIRLVVTTKRFDLEEVEAQDEADSGYLWKERREEAEFDLNPPDQRLWITPDDLD